MAAKLATARSHNLSSSFLQKVPLFGMKRPFCAK
jgi:hypothetical protein